METKCRLLLEAANDASGFPAICTYCPLMEPIRSESIHRGHCAPMGLFEGLTPKFLDSRKHVCIVETEALFLLCKTENL